MKDATLDTIIEVVLTGGLLLSAAMLVFGLLTSNVGALRAGILLLMMTPAARVVVVTGGLIVERDWTFALVSLWVLSVLGSSVWVAFRG